jgi:hypothetical protein
MPMNDAKIQDRPIAQMLSGGDRRSIGRVNDVVGAALKKPALVSAIVQALTHEDVVVRMRAGDALEKLHRHIPEHVSKFQRQLLKLAEHVTEQELRWHLAQILAKLSLPQAERVRFEKILDVYASDKSAIVRVSALQALADLAEQNAALRIKALNRVRAALRSGTPAEKARARRLLGQLQQ